MTSDLSLAESILGSVPVAKFLPHWYNPGIFKVEASLNNHYVGVSSFIIGGIDVYSSYETCPCSPSFWISRLNSRNQQELKLIFSRHGICLFSPIRTAPARKETHSNYSEIHPGEYLGVLSIPVKCSRVEGPKFPFFSRTCLQAVEEEVSEGPHLPHHCTLVTVPILYPHPLLVITEARPLWPSGERMKQEDPTSCEWPVALPRAAVRGQTPWKWQGLPRNT